MTYCILRGNGSGLFLNEIWLWIFVWKTLEEKKEDKLKEEVEEQNKEKEETGKKEERMDSRSEDNKAEEEAGKKKERMDSRVEDIKEEVQNQTFQVMDSFFVKQIFKLQGVPINMGIKKTTWKSVFIYDSPLLQIIAYESSCLINSNLDIFNHKQQF